MATNLEDKNYQKYHSIQRDFIFHIDLDCFFAAVEMREDPTLIGKPIMVGGNKETKRGVVLTCNYEARKFGVRSGMSALEAIKLCPEIICVNKGHYQLYREVSESVMSILSSYTDEFRCASIDEAYLNLTHEVNKIYHGNPIPLAEEIKNKIFEVEKITCSVGIGCNTTIAKIATTQKKPNGVTYVPKEVIKEFLTPLPVRRILGIGPKTAQYLKEKHGIETIGQIIALETEYEMIRKFGNIGKYFFRVISGEGNRKIVPNNRYSAKSISSGRTFYGYKENGAVLTAETILPHIIDDVFEQMKKRDYRFKTVTLEVRFQRNLQTISKSKSFLVANNDKERIASTVNNLLVEIKKDNKNSPIRKVAVRVSNLIKIAENQKTLFDFVNK